MSARQKPPKFADIHGEYWKLFLDCKVTPLTQLLPGGHAEFND